MTIQDFLFRKVAEHPAAQQAFFTRLDCKDPRDPPTRMDIIRYCYQLYFLYAALERSVLRFPDSKILSLFHEPPLQGRSALLKQDLREMISCLSREEYRKLRKTAGILPTTRTFVEQVKAADELSLFAFLTARSLGDCHSNYVPILNKTFGREMQNHFPHSIRGFRDTLQNFVNEALTCTAQPLFAEAVDKIFDYHQELFIALENERLRLSLTNSAEKLSLRARATLFATTGMSKVATAAVELINWHKESKPPQ